MYDSKLTGKTNKLANLSQFLYNIMYVTLSQFICYLVVVDNEYRYEF